MPTRKLLGLLVIFACLTVAAGGCRRRSVRAVATGGEGGGGGSSVQVGGGETVAHGSPREQLEQMDQVLRQQGYAPVGPATHASLEASALTAYAMDVRRGHCYVVAVFGAPGSDPNLVMLDPAGRDIGHDVRPNEHPWVSFCAARGGRFVARVQMARGSGEYYFSPYVVRGRRPADLTAFFGGSATATATASIDGETVQRLQALDQQLGGESFTRVGEPSGLLLGEREERVFQLSLEQGRCYAFGTLGGPGTSDTDVFLQDGSGQRLQADTSTERDALIRYCSPETTQYTLQVRLFRGQGSVFTVAYAQPPAAGATASSEPAEPVISEVAREGEGLDENFALLDADMRARGYESFGEPQHGELGESAEQLFGVDLEGGKCYAILAVGDSGVRDMTLALLDASGREVDRDEAGDARPTVRVCPQSTGHYQMRVRMLSGSGSYVYAPYRWPRGTRLGDLEGILYVRLAEVTALLQVEGFSPDPSFSIDRGRLAREGQDRSHTLQLSAGQCYSVVVVGGEGVRDLDVTLSLNGAQLATDFGARNAFPSVRHCAAADGTYSVAVRAASGAGDYVFQVFSQQGSAQF